MLALHRGLLAAAPVCVVSVKPAAAVGCGRGRALDGAAVKPRRPRMEEPVPLSHDTQGRPVYAR